MGIKIYIKGAAKQQSMEETVIRDYKNSNAKNFVVRRYRFPPCHPSPIGYLSDGGMYRRCSVCDIKLVAHSGSRLKEEFGFRLYGVCLEAEEAAL